MNPINCKHRTTDVQPACRIVASLVDLPVVNCPVNDEACRHCLGCGIAPQTPNQAVASLAMLAARRTGDTAFLSLVAARMKPHLRKVPAVTPPTACIRRGPQIRTVECKPCQAGGGPLMVPVFRCPVHNECTLHNIGVHPRIKACATCDDRLEKSYQIDIRPVPQAVLDQIHARR